MKIMATIAYEVMGYVRTSDFYTSWPVFFCFDKQHAEDLSADAQRRRVQIQKLIEDDDTLNISMVGSTKELTNEFDKMMTFKYGYPDYCVIPIRRWD